MTLEELGTLYDYDAWANARVFATLEALDPERLRAPVESSFPSLLGTMAHLVAAEWVWLMRWQGHSPSAFPPWLVEPRLDDLRARLAEVESQRAAFLAGLTQGALEAPLPYRTLSGDGHRDRLVDLLLHVVNHSSYHRGQLTTMLRQLGATPTATDYVLFLRERAG